MTLTYRHVKNTIRLPEVVRLRCDRCGRKGQYRRQRFIDISGTDTGELLDFARAVGCPTAIKQKPGEWYDRCGIIHDWSPEELARITRGEDP